MLNLIIWQIAHHQFPSCRLDGSIKVCSPQVQRTLAIWFGGILRRECLRCWVSGGRYRSIAFLRFLRRKGSLCIWKMGVIWLDNLSSISASWLSRSSFPPSSVSLFVDSSEEESELITIILPFSESLESSSITIGERWWPANIRGVSRALALIAARLFRISLWVYSIRYEILLQFCRRVIDYLWLTGVSSHHIYLMVRDIE